VPRLSFMAPVTLAYALAIALLMVSRLPVYSGKRLGTRVPPDLVLLTFVGVVLFFAMLISYPWEVLTIGTVLYLVSLPFGWLSYRDQVRRDAEALVQAKVAQPGEKSAEPAVPAAPLPDKPLVAPLAAPDEERPTRH
jgi:CDP-diacylglycerol--serine O-phosphatidyltransferase